MKKPTREEIEARLGDLGVEFDSVAFAASIELKPGSVVAIGGSPVEIAEVTAGRISGRVISAESWARAHVVMKTTGDPSAAREVLDFGTHNPRKGRCQLIVNGPVWRYRFTKDSVMLTSPKPSRKGYPIVRIDFMLPIDWVVAVEHGGDVKTILWSNLLAGVVP